MESTRKKQYMKQYNQKLEVKARKAAHMRSVRAEKEQEAARKVVQAFLEFGFENLAEEFARERAPEMLLTIKARRRR